MKIVLPWWSLKDQRVSDEQSTELDLLVGKVCMVEEWLARMVRSVAFLGCLVLPKIANEPKIMFGFRLPVRLVCLVD